MIQVALLTEQQAEQIHGQEFAPDCRFNVVYDKYDRPFISLEEVEQCSIEWVKTLPTMDYEPKEVTLI